MDLAINSREIATGMGFKTGTVKIRYFGETEPVQILIELDNVSLGQVSGMGGYVRLAHTHFKGFNYRPHTWLYANGRIRRGMFGNEAVPEKTHNKMIDQIKAWVEKRHQEAFFKKFLWEGGLESRKDALTQATEKVIEARLALEDAVEEKIAAERELRAYEKTHA